MTKTIAQSKARFENDSSMDEAKALGILTAFAPIIFVLTSISLETLDPTYNWLRDTISELVYGRNGWILTLNFYVFGIVLLLLAIRLSSSFAKDFKSELGLAFLAAFGLAFQLLAIFPTQAPGAPQSISGLIHLNTVRAMVLIFPAFCLLFGSGIKQGDDTRILRAVSLAAGGIGLALVVPATIASITGAPWIGAIERVILTNGLVWIEAVAIVVTFPGIGRRFHRFCRSYKSVTASIQETIRLFIHNGKEFEMKKLLIVAILAAITLPVLSVGCGPDMGGQTTQYYEYSNFSNVQINSAFEVEIIPSGSYSVQVTAPENYMKHVKVEQSGSTLTIGVEPAGFFWNWGNSRFQAKITMPEIAVLDVSGASKVAAKGFSSTNDFKLTLSGASATDIDIEAYDTSIVLTGASKVGGNLEGHDVRLNISGASTAQLEGSGNNINLQASGASRANLSSLTSNDMRVDLSGASRADVMNNGKLDVFLSGASNLKYGGNPDMGTVEVSGGSTLSQS